MTTEQKNEINDCSKCKNCQCKKVEPKICIQCNKNEKMKDRKICYECKKLWLKQYYIDKLKIDILNQSEGLKLKKLKKLKKQEEDQKKKL